MKKALFLQVLILAFLLPAAGMLAVRTLRRADGLKIPLGGKDATSLRPETVQYLAGLKGRVDMTYFVSSADALPSALRGIEASVRSLLEAMERAAPDRIDFRILDPKVDPKNGPPHAAGKKASPVNRRKILQDETAQEEVWSSLAIAHERYRDALIQGILPADLPYLEDLILAHLRAGPAPIRPSIVVSVSEAGHDRLLGEIAALPGAQVLSIDFNRSPRLPEDADLFIWIDPERPGDEHRDELKRFLDSGRSAIVAGGAYSLEPIPAAEAGGAIRFRPKLSSCDWEMLLRPWGLSLAPLILTDKQQEAASWRRPDGGALQVEAPFQIRLPASLWDMRSMLGPPLGALLLRAASPIRMDRAILERAGLDAEVVATTSEFARVLELPEAEFGKEAFERAVAVPKQPWLALVKPRDAWKGQLLLSGASSLFHDDLISQAGNADHTFLRTLLRTFTESGRLARARVPRRLPERVPPMTSAARLSWRAAAVFLIPAALLILASRRRRAARPGPRRTAALRLFAASGGGCIALLLLFRILGSWRGPAADCTEDHINTPSPLTSRLLDRFRGSLTADIIISDGLYMPASMKRIESRLLSTLRWLRIPARFIRPEELAGPEQEALRKSGIVPFEEDKVRDDLAVPVRIWSALRLRHGEQVEAVPKIDLRAAEHLEFLLAAAVLRLETGRALQVGVLSDLPRLSPAEAHRDYQQQGTIAPIGNDVYSQAKGLLEQHGYRVSYINPESPAFPPGLDLLIWLQPRYPWKAFQQFNEFLAGGGKAIVALQPYNIQQLQHRGAGFNTDYWPQPQFHSFNEYLSLIGAPQSGEKAGDQPGEILFDRQHGSLVLDTQVMRSAFREHNPQQVARPFLIRVFGAGLSAASPITSKLGQLLFIWGSRFRLDGGKLDALGLSRTLLAASSPDTWTYAWSGGWIPEASFDPAAAISIGSQPLAVLLEGAFPKMGVKKEEAGSRGALLPPEQPGDPARPGKLLLIGCSEMFKNRHLFDAGYQHNQFLLNAAAFLAHGPEMAEIQARRRAPRSFAPPPAETRLALRAAAIGLAPLAFILYGLARRIIRRRPVLGGRR